MEKGGTVSTVPPFSLWRFASNMNSAVLQENDNPSSQLTKAQCGLLIGLRSLTALALSLWIGGMAFFGIMAAPVMFRLARQSSAPQLAPQMVGAMLTRFGFVTTACALLMLIGWFVDGLLSKTRGQKLWKVQGVLSLICLGFSLYLNNVLLPQTQAQQAEILPIFARDARGETLTPQEIATRAAFDSGHHAYQRLASINLYLLLAILVIISARSLPQASISNRS